MLYNCPAPPYIFTQSRRMLLQKVWLWVRATVMVFFHYSCRYSVLESGFVVRIAFFGIMSFALKVTVPKNTILTIVTLLEQRPSEQRLSE